MKTGWSQIAEEQEMKHSILTLSGDWINTDARKRYFHTETYKVLLCADA